MLLDRQADRQTCSDYSKKVNYIHIWHFHYYIMFAVIIKSLFSVIILSVCGTKTQKGKYSYHQPPLMHLPVHYLIDPTASRYDLQCYDRILFDIR